MPADRPRELQCRHTWSLWAKDVPPVAVPGGRERPVATYRSNCTRCALFRVVVVDDGGEAPGRAEPCARCFLPLNDPPGALRWTDAVGLCDCGVRAWVDVNHTYDDACYAARECAECGTTFREPLGR